MRQKLFFSILFLINMLLNTIAASEVKVYLFPGQGSDHRLFQEFKFPSDYDVNYIVLPVPEKNADMRSYAMQISEQIDTSGYTIFIGTSLGGMICSELNNVFNVEKTIVISSAKCRKELPLRYRFQKYIPLNKILPKRLIKWGALLAQPLVEPDRRHNKSTFKDMLKKKDPLYLKRTIDIIVNWNGEEYNDQIFHIHGNKDHTLPIKMVKYDVLINKGSHMMTLTRGKEIFKIIEEYLGIYSDK